MRTTHRTPAIVAVLGIAFSVTACGGTDTKPTALQTVPKATATASPSVSPVATPSVTPGNLENPKSVDASLKMDLNGMRIQQEVYITDNPGKQGIAVAATKPGGRASVNLANDFITSPGNVIAVQLYRVGYCLSGYNTAASEATSPSMSMLYLSDSGFADMPGACPAAAKPLGVDASLKADINAMRILQETYATEFPTKLPGAAETKPGGTATFLTPNDFHASPGNVVAIKGRADFGYCISAYNKAATKANSATRSMVYDTKSGAMRIGGGC